MSRDAYTEESALEHVAEIHARAEELLAEIRAAYAEGQTYDEESRLLRQLIIPGIYGHFKGKQHDQKFYVVDALSVDVNGQEDVPVVTYAALYGTHAGQGASRKLLHPKDAFFGPIIRPNDPEYPYTGKRFVLVRPLDLIQIAKVRHGAATLADHHTELEFMDALNTLLDT